MRSRSALFWLLAALLSVMILGCAPIPLPPTASQTGGEPAAAPITLNIFAAASLTDAFTEIGESFSQENPGVRTVFNFAGSNQLATQIREGAPADLFASANSAQMDAAIESGRIVRESSQTFVRNRLVVIVPSDNPAQLFTLQDLTKPGVKIAFAAVEVPVGRYTLDFLDRAATVESLGAGYRDGVIANVVSYEANVRVVLTKVTLGEADAGVVYTSDVAAAAGEVIQIEIPDELNTIASYPMAPLADSAHPEMAQKFVDYVLSPPGQRTLAAYGFIPALNPAD